MKKLNWVATMAASPFIYYAPYIAFGQQNFDQFTKTSNNLKCICFWFMKRWQTQQFFLSIVEFTNRFFFWLVVACLDWRKSGMANLKYYMHGAKALDKSHCQSCNCKTSFLFWFFILHSLYMMMERSKDWTARNARRMLFILFILVAFYLCS